MTDRDTFAAAALTGLLSNVQRYQNEPLTRQAYEIADFMLRERDRQPAPPRVETDGFSPGSSSDLIDRNAERESPRRECGESQLRDVPQADNARAAGGPEHHIFEHQHPTLTAEEREAVLCAACYFDTRPDLRMQEFGSALRLLLERMG